MENVFPSILLREMERHGVVCCACEGRLMCSLCRFICPGVSFMRICDNDIVLSMPLEWEDRGRLEIPIGDHIVAGLILCRVRMIEITHLIRSSTIYSPAQLLSHIG